jgi:hypothetical protein
MPAIARAEPLKFAASERPPSGSQYDKPPILDPVERIGVGGVIAVVMGNRYPYRLSRAVTAGKDRLVVLDAQVNVAAGEHE